MDPESDPRPGAVPSGALRPVGAWRAFAHGRERVGKARARGAPAMLLVWAIGLAAAAIASCAAWEAKGDSCVMESGDGERRVINYTDPELCDRPVKKRQPDYLRVPPPEEG